LPGFFEIEIEIGIEIEKSVGVGRMKRSASGDRPKLRTAGSAALEPAYLLKDLLPGFFEIEIEIGIEIEKSVGVGRMKRSASGDRPKQHLP
jgi:hypothetical protein